MLQFLTLLLNDLSLTNSLEQKDAFIAHTVIIVESLVESTSTLQIADQDVEHSFMAIIGKYIFSKLFSNDPHTLLHLAPSRILLIECYCILVNKLHDQIALHAYNDWLNIGVHGLADFDSSVRRLAISGFHCLLPFAPFAAQRLGLNCHRVPSTTYTLLDCFSSKENPLSLSTSTNPIDQFIVQHLMPGRPFSQCNTELRQYQWDGVSWWTLLRRCGLSGMIADEM
jgi:hypothetical protein